MDIIASKTSALNVVPGLNPSPSLKARLAHLADEKGPREILREIYASDASVCSLKSWEILAKEYVGNRSWRPSLKFVDDRIADLDPSLVPEEKFTPEILQSVFTSLRGEFIKSVVKFQMAVKTNNSPQALDTEFWEQYALHDKAVYYIYRLFHEKPNQDCLLIDFTYRILEREITPPQTMLELTFLGKYRSRR